MKRLILIVLVAGVFAAPAHADVTDVTAASSVQVFLRDAAEYWAVIDPAVRATTPITVVVSPIAGAWGYDGTYISAPAAQADLNSSLITLAPLTYALGGFDMCLLITHEYGHLLGFPDEASLTIMGYDWAKYDVPTCVQSVWGWNGVRGKDRSWLKKHGLAAR